MYLHLCAQVGKMISNLGGCYRNLGQHDKAKALFLEAMSIADQLEDTLQVVYLVYVCGNLGHCCFQAGDLDEAISYYRLQLATSQKLGREEMFDYPARASMGLGVALRFQVRAMLAGSLCVWVRVLALSSSSASHTPRGLGGARKTSRASLKNKRAKTSTFQLRSASLVSACYAKYKVCMYVFIYVCVHTCIHSCPL